MPYNGYMMGSIIREDTEGEPSAVLTETGKGGLLSQGYLRDAPAREYVGDGETAVFVLTDSDTGVERERDGARESIRPGKKYRAITVVTDRRVIILVGNAADGSDKRVTLPLVEVTAARAADGKLVLTMSSGVTWRCHADSDGIDEVATYVDTAADTWREVEATLDSVKRAIVDATAHRDDGEYEAALDAMRAARDDVEAVQERTEAFTSQWPGDAMVDRVDGIRDRCLETAADIRVGYARATIDEGEAHWRDGEYEAARTAFEDAREAFEAVRSLAPRHRTAIDDVDEALDRLDRSIERLDDAPLRNAIDADRRARESEPSCEALDALAEARKRYAVVLELDPGTGERRFAGDRDRIREQREDVTDRFVETALEVGTDALDAGEWYCGSGQEELAVEELDRAIEVLDRGRAIAESERPAHAEECRQKLSRARELLEELSTNSDDGSAATVDRATAAEATTEDGDSRTPEGEAATPDGDATAAPGGDATAPDSDTAPAEGDATAPDSDTAPTEGDATAPDSDTAPAEGDATAPDSDAAAADGGVAPIDQPDASPPSPTADDQDLLHSPVAPGGVTDERTDEHEPSRSASADATRTDDETATLVARLRKLSQREFESLVTTVVETTGWQPHPTASTACDYLATRGEDSGTLAIRTFPADDDDPIDADAIREAATLAASVPSVDRVMVVTVCTVTDDARAAARSQGVRILDAKYLARAVATSDHGSLDAFVQQADE